MERKKFCDTCKKKFLRQCLQCNKRFDKYTEILDHIKNNCSADSSCPQCGIKIKNNEELEDHFQNCGNNSSYACTKCSFITDSKKTIIAHRKSHERVIDKIKNQNKRKYYTIL